MTGALLAQADALAAAGDFMAAPRLIAARQADCVPCLTARGDIAALAQDHALASYWVARSDALVEASRG